MRDSDVRLSRHAGDAVCLRTWAGVYGGVGASYCRHSLRSSDEWEVCRGAAGPRQPHRGDLHDHTKFLGSLETDVFEVAPSHYVHVAQHRSATDRSYDQGERETISWAANAGVLLVR